MELDSREGETARDRIVARPRDRDCETETDGKAGTQHSPARRVSVRSHQQLSASGDVVLELRETNAPAGKLIVGQASAALPPHTPQRNGDDIQQGAWWWELATFMRKDFVQEERQELCYKQQSTIACSLERVGGYCISASCGEYE